MVGPAVNSGVGVVPAYGFSFQVHIPDGVVGSLDCQAQPLFVLTERLLHVFTIGNVDVDSRQTNRLVRLVLHNSPAAAYPANASIGPDNTPLRFGGMACLERLRDQLHHASTVVRMDETLPVRLGSGKPARRQAVNRLEFRSPCIQAGVDVPIESADACRLLSETQARL